jgi:hypothetical protein
MSLLLSQRPKKTLYARGAVVCRKCAAPIYVYMLKALAEEFSLHCSKCGDRGLYSKHAITIEELPERLKKPRN